MIMRLQMLHPPLAQTAPTSQTLLQPQAQAKSMLQPLAQTTPVSQTLLQPQAQAKTMLQLHLLSQRQPQLPAQPQMLKHLQMLPQAQPLQVHHVQNCICSHAHLQCSTVSLDSTELVHGSAHTPDYT